MKTIGLIGGMTWESTVIYYQVINRIVARELGGLNSARIVMHSVNLADIVELPKQDRWDEAGAMLAAAGKGLKAAGADFLVLCVNTMHKVAPQIERESGLPLLHIIDATVRRLRASKIDRIALLGTRFVMEEDFYRGRLESEHGLKVLIPNEEDRQFVHSIIYDEMAKGIFSAASRNRCGQIIAGLVDQGAQGAILGCTELPLLLSSEDSPVSLFATTDIHAEEAALLAIGKTSFAEFTATAASAR